LANFHGCFSTNSFDLAVYACLFVAVVMGFMTGPAAQPGHNHWLYLGGGIAVAAAPKTVSLLANYPKIPTPQTWIVVVAIFILAGALISALLRLIVSGMTGRNISVPDRIAGAAARWRSLRHARDHAGACLRSHVSARSRAGFPQRLAVAPVLSSAAQYGIQSLPPEAKTTSIA
jgi:hypothetical protein